MPADLSIQSFQDLQERFQSAKEKLAVLKANEERKAKERKTLLDELASKGIDIKKLSDERARLERELNDVRERQDRDLTKFETELETLTAGDPNG